jgi:hypothetical protein
VEPIKNFFSNAFSSLRKYKYFVTPWNNYLLFEVFYKKEYTGRDLHKEDLNEFIFPTIHGDRIYKNDESIITRRNAKDYNDNEKYFKNYSYDPNKDKVFSIKENFIADRFLNGVLSKDIRSTDSLGKISEKYFNKEIPFNFQLLMSYPHNQNDEYINAYDKTESFKLYACRSEVDVLDFSNSKKTKESWKKFLVPEKSRIIWFGEYQREVLFGSNF